MCGVSRTQTVVSSTSDSENEVTQLYLTFCYQTPPSMGFSRQEYWSRLPFPSPGDLPNPGIEPRSTCIVGRCFTIWAIREVHSQVGINPWQCFCHKLMRLLGNHRAGLLTCFAQWVSFTQTHCRDSKVQQKTCLLGEQRTRAPSILTLSWRIPDKPPRWKVAAEPQKIPGFLASGGEEFNPWPVMSLDHSELLCNKVLLKDKRDRENSVY